MLTNHTICGAVVITGSGEFLHLLTYRRLPDRRLPDLEFALPFQVLKPHHSPC